MSNHEYYRAKIARRGKNSRERNFKLKEKAFNDFFENTLTKSDCLIDGRQEELVFQDHSQSNNKDLSDDKYIVAKNETEVGIGSYIMWQNAEWLVFTEEHKTIPTHQQLKIKAVNETIKWMLDGEICNDGKGYGAYVQSQTLYTLGVSVTANLAAVDSKMMMYMQNNAITRTLKVDNRIFIGFKVYKIKFTDPVSRPGLINYLLEEDTISDEYDNVELGIADYWKDENQDHDGDNGIEAEIEGGDTVKIGNTYVYNISEGNKVSEWIIEYLDNDESCVYILDRNETSVTLQFKNDFRYVGAVVNLIAKVNDQYVMKTLNIIKRF